MNNTPWDVKHVPNSGDVTSTIKPIIHVHTLTYNEEAILPFFLQYYSTIADKIYIYDSMSTDKTIEIANKNPKVILESWTTSNDNQLDEYALTNLRATKYKISRGIADWVIVCDTDEFYYHPNIIELLRSYKLQGINIPKTIGYQMVSDVFPSYADSIINQCQYGCYDSRYSKYGLFDPSIDIVASLGLHPESGSAATFLQSPGIKRSLQPEIKMLHYKHLSVDYTDKMWAMSASRLTKECKQRGYGTHVIQNRESVESIFHRLNSSKIKVI